jgi:hypothetical protein
VLRTYRHSIELRPIYPFDPLWKSDGQIAVMHNTAFRQQLSLAIGQRRR